MSPAKVAIVDYGLGNLFSVKHACEYAGLPAEITSDAARILSAAGVVLPGVGAFGEAMKSLKKLGLADPLRKIAASGKPFLGICLGMQLLMKESFEFGHHEGLGVLEGAVLPLKKERSGQAPLKVPHIGWTGITPNERWEGSLLEGLEAGVVMYFVHSFYCEPADRSLALSWTEFGPNVFCSAFRRGNIEAFQFHPERSGRHGLSIYENFAKRIQRVQGDKNDKARHAARA
jgi:glutamine amidotransferase